MNRIFISLLVVSAFFSSCMKDTSAYLPQDKKDVNVDKFNTDTTSNENQEGMLSPGIHQVKMQVTIDGTESERRFKYFMPVSIDKAKEISLIFNFHGSYDTKVNPIEGVSLSHPLSQLAIKENCIIVFPAGEDNGMAVNWQNTEYNLAFVDSMLAYFNRQKPTANLNRIYTTGHSSGAIFSFALAYYRSEIFAAAVPVSGQMRLPTTALPSRVVPIRAFNGINDNSVIHSAALSNINIWASTIGGYFSSDAGISDTLEIDNYKQYMTRVWHGGRADIEFFTVLDEGHGINWFYITPLIWDFMKSHPKGAVSTSVYLTSEVKKIMAMEGQTIRSEIKHSDGAVVSIISSPADWNVTYNNNILTVKAPGDFFAPSTMNRSGEIKLKADLNGSSVTISIPFSLIAPKTYFEIGDLVYDDNYEPAGVVFWVNPANIKEAKIVALEHILKKFGSVGNDFFTPDFEDGYANTLALIDRVKTKNLDLDAASSAFVYAYEYKASPGNTIGWYLPAVDELKKLGENISLVNNALARYGTPLQISSLAMSYHLSSTMVNAGSSSAPFKRFYTFDFYDNPSYFGYYTLSQSADNTAGFVSTRPVKKVYKP